MKKTFFALFAMFPAILMAAGVETAYLGIKLTGKTTTAYSKVKLTEKTDKTNDFENGSDAELISLTPSNDESVFLYGVVGTHKCSSVYDNDLSNLELCIQTNRVDDQYVLTFTSVSGRTLRLYDAVTEVWDTIVKDGTYEFKVTAENCPGFVVGNNVLVTGRFYIEPVHSYQRDMASGNWATVCFPYKFVGESGVDKLYSLTAINSEGTKVAIDEVAIEDVVAGKPYIFQSDSAAQEFKYKPENKVLAPDTVGSHGLIGVFEDTVFTEQVYLVVNNAITLSAVGSDLAKYRCFIDLNRTPVDDDAFTQHVPGRRIFNVKNTPANVVNVSENVNRNGKIIRNGEFIIMREGRKYNAQGQEL